jgi:hypothetical protein
MPVIDDMKPDGLTKKVSPLHIEKRNYKAHFLLKAKVSSKGMFRIKVGESWFLAENGQ